MPPIRGAAVRDPLPAGFRKLSLIERRELLRARHPDIAPAGFGTDPDLVELADVMVESAVGYLAVPMGIAAGFLIDGVVHDVPLATEEPSVIAAAGYAASIVRRGGGFTTEAGRTITTGQLFVEGATAGAEARLAAAEPRLREIAEPLLERMAARGGGWRGVEVQPLADLLRVDFHVDVRDAMGANVVNTVGEALREAVELTSGGRVVMAILTNASDPRRFTARFSLPASRLARAGVPGPEAARRIVLANRIAELDPSRAVTHNKGIMNGITSLALATGNDTRALEAAAHHAACTADGYRALTRYRLENDTLHGELSMPIALGTVGGAAGIHPTSAAALEILGRPEAITLGRIAVSVGLAQNLAALFALVTEGIQRGHMGLHAGRVAWAAGARGEERAAVTEAMRSLGRYDAATAAAELARLRARRGS